ncbi:unnamed protein product [Durusdinium trenchii]|uniref:Uncharacterized protein n=1 Tax=Durusdinium trenchii TaxID=1381693 RepID=A0ABP0S4R4_9DINO
MKVMNDKVVPDACKQLDKITKMNLLLRCGQLGSTDDRLGCGFSAYGIFKTCSSRRRATFCLLRKLTTPGSFWSGLLTLWSLSAGTMLILMNSEYFDLITAGLCHMSWFITHMEMAGC